MAKTQPTPEEIEAARQMVAEADAAAAAEKKSVVLEKLKPFMDAGLGAAEGGAVGPLITALQAGYTTLAEIDPTLPNLAFSTAQVLQTLDNRIRSLVAANSPLPAPAPGA